jgi:hypothetical protein
MTHQSENPTDDDTGVIFGTGIDFQAQYEAFRLYSSHGGQEGIPRRAYRPAAGKAAGQQRATANGRLRPQSKDKKAPSRATAMTSRYLK